ncbi:hypothetical protein H2200_000995 [Cladophialophora chaetospira]|uniref:Uncharacterized protein n=1 Tax=Cladophialophora chaetospira TaxID=386627 RepID=A0AA39CPP6_9EURO|nr:hypothetical protein H2200_000995 [Cladophialophora chaetospira]
MDAFSKEIASLIPCLEALQRPDLIHHYPDALRPNLVTIIRECDGVAGKMRELLSKLSSASVGRRMQWSLTSRDETGRLRQSLEAHKSALQIAISLVSLSATQSLQNDTSSIRVKAALLPEMRADTAQIADLRREISALRIDMTLQHTIFSVPMQRFLDESTAYAETVYDDLLDTDEREVPGYLGTSRRASNASKTSTKTSTIEASGVQQRPVDPPEHNLPSCQNDHIRVKQELLDFSGSSSNASAPSRTSPVKSPTPMTDIMLTGGSAVKDAYNGFEHTDEVNHETSTYNAKPLPKDTSQGIGLLQICGRGVDNATEVEDWPPANPALEEWAKDFHDAVYTDFLRGKEIAKAKLKLPIMVSGRLAGVHYQDSDAQRLVALLLLEPLELNSHDCNTFFENMILTRKSFVLEPIYVNKILQHAIRLYQTSVFDLVFDHVKKQKNLASINTEEILLTAVRCGHIAIIQRLLRHGLQPRHITANDVWLGSCYTVWLGYSLKTETSLCSGLSEGRRYMLGWCLSSVVEFKLSKGDTKLEKEQPSKSRYAKDTADFQQAYENQIRKTLGWDPIDFEARGSKAAQEDIMSCSRYLKVKSEDYERQTWRTYRLSFREETE